MSEPPPAESVTSGNTEEDWHIFEILCKDINMEEQDVDLTTSLRSEIAALQYKRDKLQADLEEMRSQVRSRDQRCLDLQVETDQLREQTARQNVIISSLKKRVHELEERERNFIAAQGRHEIALQTAHRDIRYNEEKVKELEAKIRNLALDLNTEEQSKDAVRLQFQDFVRRLSVALGSDVLDCTHISIETLIHKAAELVQETSRLRNKACNIGDSLNNVELDLRTCRESFDRCMTDKECLQRQSATQILEIDRLRQEKESLEMQHRVTERELNELKEKLMFSNRSLGTASGNIAQQESAICQLREELKLREDRIQRLQADHKHSLESIAIMLSTPTRFVESLEVTIKDRIHEILSENQEKTAITALERARKVEDLQKRLIESETLRTKYNRKVTQLKDQVRTTGETIEQERNINDHSLQLLRDELARVKETLLEIQRREAQLQSFKHSVAKILGVALPLPDYELVSRLQKLVDAHHDFTLVSRRYDDPVLRLTARSPTGGSRCTRTPDRSRYDDSGYTDPVDLDDIDDDLFKRQTRPI